MSYAALAQSITSTTEHSSGVYIIENLLDGNVYVGLAKNFSYRWRTHRRNLDRNRHDNTPLQEAWNCHGASAFVFRVLLYCDPAFLVLWEQIAIDGFKLTVGWDSMYNLSPIAGVPTMLGREHSLETRKKQSLSAKGKNTWTKGTKQSTEWIAKRTAVQKGREKSAQEKTNISKGLTGKKQSPEAVEKRIAPLRGRAQDKDFVSRRIEGTKRGLAIYWASLKGQLRKQAIAEEQRVKQRGNKGKFKNKQMLEVRDA